MGQSGIGAMLRASFFVGVRLPVSVALLAASVTVNAATYEVTLVEHLIGRADNTPSPVLINPAPVGSIPGDSGNIPTPDCTFDDVTEEVSCTGTLHFRSQINPSFFGRIFDRFIVDLNIVGGSAGGTASYECVTGGFSQAVGANFCGNYLFGANFEDDSSITYGPGLAFSRTIGGDDGIAGDQQSINDYHLSVASFTAGGQLILRSNDWLEQPQVPVNSTGTQLTFDVGDEVGPPVPTARNDSFEVEEISGTVMLNVLANDTGFGSPVEVTLETAPDHGFAEVTGSPGDPASIRVAYTPAAGFSGTDSFIYRIESDVHSDTATVTISVTAAPVPQIYQVTLVEHLIRRVGGEPSASLINPQPSFSGDTGNIPPANCTFNEASQQLSCSGVIHARTQVHPLPAGRIFDRYITDLGISNGVASASAYGCATGGFQFAVSVNFCGNYLFGPNAENDSSLSYGLGTEVTRTMAGDDVVAGEPQSIRDYDLPVISFVAGPGGELIFEPPTWESSGYSGTRLKFAVGHPIGPAVGVAVDDSFDVPKNSPGVALDVLANDLGFENPAVVTLESTPANGAAMVSGSPGHPALIRIDYTPDSGFTGADTFVYRVEDGTYSRTATVTITVIEPEAVNDQAVARNGVPAVIDVLANDIGFADPLSVTMTSLPAHGSAVVTGSPGSASGVRIVYTPEEGYTGPDSLSYEVSDGINSGTATVSISVVVYKAIDDSAVAVHNWCCIYIPVAENDFGFQNPVTISIVQWPNRNGSVYVYGSPGHQGDVAIEYYPYPYGNPDSYVETFRYQITDGINTDTATVRVNVVSHLAVDDSATAYGEHPVVIPVTYNDMGFDYPRTVGVFSNPQNGSVTVNPVDSHYGEPTITYTAAPGFRGVDTFQYALDDGSKVGVATVTVNVIDDSDGDGIDDTLDNCTLAPNADQRDTDGDGYGNACDGDLDNNGVVNFVDLAIFRSRFGSNDPHADLDGNGVVNFIDLAIFQSLFGKPPGPSALAEK